MTIFLDSGPLGLLTHPQRGAEVVAVTEWLSRRLLDGAQIIVPAIVYYELKRELLRAAKTPSIARLDAFIAARPGRYPALSARARQQGKPTVETGALDIDVLIAAQSLLFEGSGETIVATTNLKHLAQFVPARHWNDIL